MSSEKISIRRAAAQGIKYLRLDAWHFPEDYLEIDIVDGEPGPWVHMWSSANALVGNENPHPLLAVLWKIDYNEEKWNVATVKAEAGATS